MFYDFGKGTLVTVVLVNSTVESSSCQGVHKWIWSGRYKDTSMFSFLQIHSPRRVYQGEKVKHISRNPLDNTICAHYNDSMKSPFPGMDPYLEHPTLWADVHDRLIAAIADELAPLLAPKYYVGLQRHAYLLLAGDRTYVGKPDVTVGLQRRPLSTWTPAIEPFNGGVGVLEVEVPMEEELDESYLEVREVQSSKLITVIEILSPVNKSHPEGREEYIEKRNQILSSRTNLVEIDLLRSGQPMTVFGDDQPSQYRVLVSPGWRRPRAQLYGFNLRQPIPEFPMPLLPKEEQPLVPLNSILHNLYARARFDLRLDYSVPPVPPLSSGDAQWALELLNARNNE